MSSIPYSATMSIVTKWKGFLSLMHFENRWQLILNRLFFRKGINFYHYKGMEILIDHDGDDACGTRMCLVSDMYRQFLRHMRLPNDINVIDLGANGGGFPLMLKAEGINIKKAVCVEMNPVTWRRLTFNMGANFQEKVVCLNQAICDRDGDVQVWLGKGGTGDSLTAADPKSKDLMTHTISCSTFDSLFNSFFKEEIIDICKIDIEGSEYDLFLNAGHDNIRSSRYLIMEIHPADAMKRGQLDRELQRLGFSKIDTDSYDNNVHLFSNRDLHN
jgi:FkbM family methyltransferase